MNFKKWFIENYGGSANDPSNVEDEGDGSVEKTLEKPGAFPTYELPKKKKKIYLRGKMM